MTGVRHSSTGITGSNDPSKQVSRTKYLEDHEIDDASIPVAKLVPGYVAIVQRTTVFFETGVLDFEEEQTGTVTIAPGYRLLHLETTYACRLRLYVTAAQRDDAEEVAREPGTDPVDGSGCMFDYIDGDAAIDTDLSPLPDGFADSADVPYRIQSLHGTEVKVGVTLTYIATEAE